MKNTKQPKRNALANHQDSARTALRRGTGPRTAIGKERTKYNAIKHGLFAEAVVLSRESRAKFEELITRLRCSLMPKGAMEEAIVEKIATTLWRQRRLFQAESAEIQNNIEDEEDRRVDALVRYRCRREEFMADSDRIGLLAEVDEYPEGLEDSLGKLHEVAEAAERYGLEWPKHSIYLGFLYGARYTGRPGSDLFDCYLDCRGALRGTAAERKARGFESPNDCARKFIAETKKEIRRLQGLWKRPAKESDPTLKGIQLNRYAIPQLDQLDRLLRYETALERTLDRALIQLERLQRTRESLKTIDVANHTMTSE